MKRFVILTFAIVCYVQIVNAQFITADELTRRAMASVERQEQAEINRVYNNTKDAFFNKYHVYPSKELCKKYFYHQVYLQYTNGGYQNNSNNNPSVNFNTNSSSGSSIRQEKVMCTMCNGRGIDPSRTDGVSYTGIHRELQYCSFCGGTYERHYHQKCASCAGKGYNIRNIYK